MEFLEQRANWTSGHCTILCVRRAGTNIRVQVTQLVWLFDFGYHHYHAKGALYNFYNSVILYSMLLVNCFLFNQVFTIALSVVFYGHHISLEQWACIFLCFGAIVTDSLPAKQDSVVAVSQAGSPIKGDKDNWNLAWSGQYQSLNICMLITVISIQVSSWETLFHYLVTTSSYIVLCKHAPVESRLYFPVERFGQISF